MTWKSEGTKYLVDQTNIFKTGGDFGETIEYNHGIHISEVTVKFIQDVDQIILVPYEQEVLKNPVEKVYEDHILHTFTAGIRNGSKIEFIGRAWNPKGDNFKNVEQYFFVEDKPAGCLSSSYSGPSWVSAKPRIIDAESRPYFKELKQLRPKASESIENCVKLLE